MAKKSRMSVLKRQRELKKAEKAALKRERREAREPRESTDSKDATREELEGYGFEPSSNDGPKD
jgi:hypothetical protein